MGQCNHPCVTACHLGKSGGMLLNSPWILSYKKVKHAWLAKLPRGARLKHGGGVSVQVSRLLTLHVQCNSIGNKVIRDCGSNLYVGMRVVEMF